MAVSSDNDVLLLIEMEGRSRCAQLYAVLVSQSVDVLVGQRALSNEQRFRRGEDSVRRIMREYVQRGQIDVPIGVQR